MSNTHRSTYRRPTPEKQHVLDAWFRARRQKQIRNAADRMERSMHAMKIGA